MKPKTILVVGLLLLLSLPSAGNAAETPSPPPTTRDQTIRLRAVPPGTMQILPKDVALYAQHGYSAFEIGPGEDQGRKFDLMPAGYTGAPNTARLLSYFSIADVHITDKESPVEGLYFGWNAPFQAGGLLSQAYSPVVLATTQVLDATVRTINALHRHTPFAFGLALGDEANSSQLNELRWFIDVMDGKYITPSSGDHLGAGSIGYQKSFQAAGLDPAIPWYQVVGNHDQFWMGIAYPSEKVRNAQINGMVFNMGSNILAPNATESTGVYVGVVDGTTPLGDVIKGGPVAAFAVPPTVAADPSRLSITTADSSTTNLINEFFNTTSAPLGHGFDLANRGKTAACYTFEPMANLPVKVIVLDDTCKSVSPTGGAAYYGSGWIDEERYVWLTHELQKGQDAGQLMILACHIPINPQKDLFDSTKDPQFYPGSYKTDAQLIETLQQYPNLILLMSGHR